MPIYLPDRIALETEEQVEIEKPEVVAPKPSVYNKDDIFDEGEISINNSDFEVSETLSNNIYELMASHNFQIGFYLIDLETQMSVGYNASTPFSTASTVKAGFALYCFKEIAAGRASFDDRMKYRQQHYITGSGSTKYSEYGTIFTIRVLLYRLLYNSDNVAYYMLVDFFGTEGYNKMMEELGINNTLTPKSRWGCLTPHELGLIWQEIYQFKDICEEGELLWEYLTGNLYNEFKEELTEYELIAHKSGWSSDSYHESGVVYGKRKYAAVVMTGTGRKNRCLYAMIRFLDDIIIEYDKWVVN